MWRGLLRLSLLFGLFFSALLLVDYLVPSPTFCGEGGGCEAVRASDYAYPGGIPTPLLGVLFFSGMLALSTLPGRWARRLLVAKAAAGALAAAFFLALQVFSLKTFCAYCVTVDGLALF